MQIPSPLLFACSTCSGVPHFHSQLIYKGIMDWSSWNTCRVQTCSKVFRVFRFRRLRQHGEQAVNPRQQWIAANSGNQISATEAGASQDETTRQTWPDRSRFDTTTHRHSPAGQWSPWRPVAPATAAESARAAGTNHQGQAAALSSGIKHCASMAPHRLRQAIPAIRATGVSLWGVAGLDAGQQPEQLPATSYSRTGACLRQLTLCYARQWLSPARLRQLAPSRRGRVKSPMPCPIGNRPSLTRGKSLL